RAGAPPTGEQSAGGQRCGCGGCGRGRRRGTGALGHRIQDLELLRAVVRDLPVREADMVGVAAASDVEPHAAVRTGVGWWGNVPQLANRDGLDLKDSGVRFLQQGGYDRPVRAPGVLVLEAVHDIAAPERLPGEGARPAGPTERLHARCP